MWANFLSKIPRSFSIFGCFSHPFPLTNSNRYWCPLDAITMSIPSRSHCLVESYSFSTRKALTISFFHLNSASFSSSRSRKQFPVPAWVRILFSFPAPPPPLPRLISYPRTLRLHTARHLSTHFFGTCFFSCALHIFEILLFRGAPVFLCRSYPFLGNFCHRHLLSSMACCILRPNCHWIGRQGPVLLGFARAWGQWLVHIFICHWHAKTTSRILTTTLMPLILLDLGIPGLAASLGVHDF